MSNTVKCFWGVVAVAAVLIHPPTFITIIVFAFLAFVDDSTKRRGDD